MNACPGRLARPSHREVALDGPGVSLGQEASSGRKEMTWGWKWETDWGDAASDFRTGGWCCKPGAVGSLRKSEEADTASQDQNGKMIHSVLFCTVM